MKNIQISLLYLLIFALCFACSSQEDKVQLPEPKLKAGMARLVITGFDEKLRGQFAATELELSVASPITGGVERANGFFDVDSSKLIFEVPLETDFTIGHLTGFVFVTLEANKEVEMKMSFDSLSLKYPYEFEFKDTFFAPEDLNKYLSLIEAMVYYEDQPILPGSRIEMDYEDLIRFEVDSNLRARFQVLDEDAEISERMKSYMRLNFSDFFINAQMFDYLSIAKLEYLYTHPKNERELYVPPSAPRREYYKFLQEFDLNNPRHAYSGSYREVLLNILSNDTINLLPIEDMLITDWLKDSKAKLRDLVGFDEGFFYDVLIGNAYSTQFDDAMKPLSNIQKKNLTAYFNGGEIEKILLRKNEEIITLDAKRQLTVINEVPNVPKEELMKAIISKYKGKVVFVDLWATWCAPCLEGINDFKKVKGNFKDKDVVFVYITNHSSPKELWSKKIEGIGGEHYYLADDNQWNYILEQFYSHSIPTYAFYDKDGRLSESFVGGRSTEELVSKLNDLLK